MIMSKTRAYARVIFSGMLGVTSGRARSSIVTSSRTNEKERCQDSHCRTFWGVSKRTVIFSKEGHQQRDTEPTKSFSSNHPHSKSTQIHSTNSNMFTSRLARTLLTRKALSLATSTSPQALRCAAAPFFLKQVS